MLFGRSVLQVVSHELNGVVHHSVDLIEAIVSAAIYQGFGICWRQQIEDADDSGQRVLAQATINKRIRWKFWLVYGAGFRIAVS